MNSIKHFLSKHLIAFSLTALSLLGLTGATFATAFATATTASAAPTAVCGNDLNCVQRAGDALIAARIASLNRLKTVTDAHQHLTDDQKSTIKQDADTNKDGLNALQQQLDAETTVAAAREDIKKMYEQFRIYAVVLPRDYGEIELFLEQNMTARMTNASPTIDDLIAQDQAAGNDVTQLNSLKSDYDAKLADATTNENAAQALIPSLIPSNYPDTDATVSTYRTDLKNARQDLKDAASDLDQMRTILQQDLGSTGGS